MQEEFLDPSAVAAQLGHHRGVIPVEIDVTRHETIWEDLGGYHCYEAFFRDSLSMCRALRTQPTTRFRTRLADLSQCLASIRSLSPTGFIFHAGRSGSTLLARALARSRSNMVFSEAAPHNQIWRALPDDGAAATRIYRDLILAMGRRRLDCHEAHIIKFSSYNIKHFASIRAAFPGVPAIFLFRDPAEILASCRKNPPVWMGRDLGRGFRWNTASEAVAEFFQSALAVHDAAFRCVHYSSLTPACLPAILEFFALNPATADLRAMRSEFAWYSKSSVVRRPFADTGQPASYGGTSPALCALYAELSRRSWLTVANLQHS